MCQAQCQVHKNRHYSWFHRMYVLVEELGTNLLIKCIITAREHGRGVCNRDLPLGMGFEAGSKVFTRQRSVLWW